MKFTDLGLPESLIRALKKSDYDEPTPVQQSTTPLIREGKDVMATSQTGTGKTAGFVLPMLELLMSNHSKQRKIRGLIITPTRELAAQVHASIEKYGRYTELKATVVFGGVNINPQKKTLRQGVDVLVASPGRFLDLHGQQALDLRHVEYFVLDEADRMLDMGFIHDIRRVCALLPKKRQTLMFSATFSPEIRALAKAMLLKPVEVDMAPRNSTIDLVEQVVHPVDKKRKADLLAYLIGSQRWEQVIVFTRTKHGANKLAKQLDKAGINAAAIHGNKSQGARTKALHQFKDGKLTALVATDIAARGIDIRSLGHVVNYDLPNVPEDYVHRIGRTGRAGSTGDAVSLVCADEIKQLRDIERLIRRDLARVEVEGFEPEHQLPVTKTRQTRQPSKGSKSQGRNRQRSGGRAHAENKPKNRIGNTQGTSRRRRRRGARKAAVSA
ncbi:MAG: DEAD/DEAH box helicase [Pseudomonadota bacterium]|nr:DEAD/DEAH box helicase [Pseudomonadota bacterium]